MDTKKRNKKKKQKVIQHKTNKVARLVLNGDVSGEDRYNPKYKYYKHDYLLKSPIMQFIDDYKNINKNKKVKFWNFKSENKKNKLDPYETYQNFVKNSTFPFGDNERHENDGILKKYFENFKDDFDKKFNEIIGDKDVKVVKVIICFHGENNQTLICAPKDCIKYMISKLSEMLETDPDKKIYIQNVACYQANIIKGTNENEDVFNVKKEIEKELGKYSDRIVYAEHSDKTTEHQINIKPATNTYPGGLKHTSFVYNKMENSKLIRIGEKKDHNNIIKSSKNIKNEILGLQEQQDTRLKPSMVV